MKINWGDSLKDWEPSDGTVRKITDDAEIKSIQSALQFYLGEEKESLIEINRRAVDDMKADNVNTWDLLGDAIEQLGVHKQVWETHIEQKAETNNYVVEFPIAIKAVQHLRYFKISFVGGAKNIRGSKISLFYHKAKQMVEVIYHE